jgi:hypothetical protein
MRFHSSYYSEFYVSSDRGLLTLNTYYVCDKDFCLFRFQKGQTINVCWACGDDSIEIKYNFGKNYDVNIPFAILWSRLI